MKKLYLVPGVLLFALVALVQNPSLRTIVERKTSSTGQTTSTDVFATAFAEHRGNFVAEGSGKVTRILSDDNDGSRHQRFVVELASGQTLLVAHNIDIAPRVASLRVGDTVAFKGEYEWSDKGGTIHWTHHDPAGRHEAGWIRHAGQTYQ